MTEARQMPAPLLWQLEVMANAYTRLDDEAGLKAAAADAGKKYGRRRG